VKIVLASNFNEDLYAERIVAENLNEYWAKKLTTAWNDKFTREYSKDYLKVVEDDYELYDGYADLR
jgi:hypothetical protein